MLKNKKGFTLIELLAVIVILAILVMVAIPAITKYLETARKGAFADTITTAVDTARNDYISGVTNHSGDSYTVADINGLLSKKMSTSPFGGTYAGTITFYEEGAVVKGCIGDSKYHIDIDTSAANDNGSYDRSDVTSGACS